MQSCNPINETKNEDPKFIEIYQRIENAIEIGTQQCKYNQTQRTSRFNVVPLSLDSVHPQRRDGACMY